MALCTALLPFVFGVCDALRLQNLVTPWLDAAVWFGGLDHLLSGDHVAEPRVFKSHLPYSVSVLWCVVLCQVACGLTLFASRIVHSVFPTPPSWLLRSVISEMRS